VTSRVARAASFLGFYGYAAYIGYTRLEGDDHYLTDVVAGAAAGIVIGRSFYNVHHPEHRTPVPHAPPAGARRGGARPIRIASLTIGRDRAAVMFGFDP
jgi:membrane-associated phospholipid phosphatase